MRSSVASSSRSPPWSILRPGCSIRRFFTGLRPSTCVAGNVIRSLSKRGWLAELMAVRRYQTCCRSDSPRTGAASSAFAPQRSPSVPSNVHALAWCRARMSPMTVVLVHGNPETDALWGPLVDALGREDVVRLSPPGFGAPLPDVFPATYLAYRD